MTITMTFNQLYMVAAIMVGFPLLVWGIIRLRRYLKNRPAPRSHMELEKVDGI
jgi:hypothetical protein